MNAPSTSYGAIHRHLQRHFIKTGQCVRCESIRRTEFALITGRAYSRNREDYLELCVPCHRRYDGNLPPVMLGAANPSVRINEAIVVEARMLHSLGEHSGRELARKYGIGKTTMQKALNRETWKHVDADALLDRASHLFDAVSQAVRNV